MIIDEDITLKKLEIFLTFMEVGNLARVSELHGQSAVSVHRALHTLEEGLGCALFKRSGRNLIPLETAHVFAEHARRTIDNCEQGIRRVRELANVNASKLRIGTLHSLTLHCIPRIIVELKLRKPDVDVTLTMGSNQALLRDLAEGNLDAVIIGLIEPPSGGDLVSVPIFDDAIYLAVPVDSPFAGLAEVDLADTLDQKFLTLKQGFVTAHSFFHAFDGSGHRPKIAMEVSDIFSLINLVSEGIGFALLPGRIASFSSRIRLVPLAPKFASKQSITLLYSQRRERDPNLLALAAECRMYARRKDQAD
jgi:LysR family malonate utilization transcriptional regulator